MKLDARVICLASGPPRALRILYPSLSLNLSAFATTPIPHRSRHGRVWRKLQRPQDYLMSAITAPPPKKLPIADTTSSTSASKRKREHANATPKHKRTRLEQDSTSKERTRVIDCGMRTILPGLDDEEHSSDDSIGEALAYLRNVRLVKLQSIRCHNRECS
jgi:hypothetical protein